MRVGSNTYIVIDFVHELVYPVSFTLRHLSLHTSDSLTFLPHTVANGWWTDGGYRRISCCTCRWNGHRRTTPNHCTEPTRPTDGNGKYTHLSVSMVLNTVVIKKHMCREPNFRGALHLSTFLSQFKQKHVIPIQTEKNLLILPCFNFLCKVRVTTSLIILVLLY